jgi:uncharacterized protein (TIGR02118 family)
VVKLTALYPMPSDAAAFDAHYFGVHVPLVERLPGVVRCEVLKIGGTLYGSPAPYYLEADTWFETEEAMLAAFGSPEGLALAADAGNFESAGAIAFVGEVRYTSEGT